MCVYVPEFAVQALLRLRPELAKSPVAVMNGDPAVEQVCSVNLLASRLGVERGMTRAQLDSFPGVSVLRRAGPEENLARGVLLETAGGFTPRTQVWPSSEAAFVMVLDVSGTARIFGSPTQIAGRIRKALASVHFFAQLAGSANVHAAVCMAPSARRAPVILAAGNEAEALRSLPLAVLGLTTQQAETMALWGLRTLGELAALPEVELVVRLGQEGKRLRLLALGEHPHLLVPEESAFTLEEFLAFDAPVELLESLLFAIGPMLDQLLLRAQNRALSLASVTVRFGLDGGGEHERTIKPALPVADRTLLLKLLHLDLQAHPPSAGVLSIFVAAEPGRRGKVQLGLFAPQLPEPMRLDVTLARIAALVGEERVGRATLTDSHRAESFAMERFTVPHSKERSKEKQEVERRHAVALRRCRPPWPLSLQCEGKRPSVFRLQGRHYTVQEAYGPWRKSGDWWSPEVWSREEWDLRAEAGEGDTLLCVVTHDLLHHHWQMEALYD
jgi:protein ImuB